MARRVHSSDDPRMTESTKAALDYGAFLQPPSLLFRDYVTGSARAAPFYDGGRWDVEALSESAERALRLNRSRQALASALVRQQEARGASEAARGARALGD